MQEIESWEKMKVSIIECLIKPKSSKKIVFSSFELFKITKKNLRERIILLFLVFVLAAFVGGSVNTAEVFTEAIQTILDVILAIFGIVFTGYSFFQALINDELLIRMIEDTVKNEEGEEISKLQETNELFVKCMMLELFSVLLSLMLKIVISCIDEKFSLFNQVWQNNLLAIILIYIYFSIIAIVLWETKSFIFNVFQLFNAYAGNKVVEAIKQNINENK